MKLIFLDIDGVLNHQRMPDDDKIYVGDYIRGNMSSRCVGLLNELTDNTGAKIVISSTWRILNSLQELQYMFSKAGITSEVIDVTPRLDGMYTLRGNEILAWMKQNGNIVGSYHNYKEYIILDDDSDMLYWQKNNFLPVDNWVGLTPNLIYRAELMLGSTNAT